MRDLQADLDEFNHWMCDNYDTYDHALIWFIRVLPEAINRAIKAEAEVERLRKVAEAAREFISSTGCNPKECGKCDPKYIGFCRWSGIGQALAELDKEES